MSSNLKKILAQDNVVLGTDALNKHHAFELVARLFEHNCGTAASIVLDSLMARESLASTGLGYGVAVPHGRIEGLKTPLAAFVRLARPIDFDAPDGKPVSMLFFLLIPQNVTQQHLEILSEIASMFSDVNCRQAMAEETDPDRIFRIITAWQPGKPIPS